MLIANDLQSAAAGISPCSALGQRPAWKQDSKMAHLPELCSDLISALACLDVHNLPHGCKASRRAGLPSLGLLNVAHAGMCANMANAFIRLTASLLLPRHAKLGNPTGKCCTDSAMLRSSHRLDCEPVRSSNRQW